MPMPLRPWVELVTSEVRKRLPDVAAVRAGNTTTWSRGKLSIAVDASDPKTWWVTFDRARVFDERHDVESAIVTAQNAIAHFT